ncbi:uncharacterized protein LOC126836597 [Adelges cooleyi]|uniref:uncharacterized protein LOC126836597 n=1 Tax=Adelges cooleyi TaxID=133065 RepID=UPI00217FD412|nr:uncharacterized protein LOC126836597 [Adelges cooleyi]
MNAMKSCLVLSLAVSLLAVPTGGISAHQRVLEYFNRFPKSDEIDSVRDLIDGFAKRNDKVYAEAHDFFNNKGKKLDILRRDKERSRVAYIANSDRFYNINVNAIKKYDSNLADLLDKYYKRLKEADHVMENIMVQVVYNQSHY